MKVAAIWRYPVKSMGAESLSDVSVSWNGLEGDRRWAFIRPDAVRSGFPWMTIRERNDMWHYQPSFVEPDEPNRSAIIVRTPDGTEFDVADPRLAAELGAEPRVLKQDRGIFDTMPVSLITTQTITDLGKEVGTELNPLRFRPNLLIDGADEDALVGSVVQIGAALIRVDGKDKRCVMINVDPETTARHTAVLRAVAQERGMCLGVYASVVRPGRINVGDLVTISGYAG
jgi:uncharacterized protein YcbX